MVNGPPELRLDPRDFRVEKSDALPEFIDRQRLEILPRQQVDGVTRRAPW